MKINIVYFVFMGTMLVSCGNTNSKVKEQTLEDIIGENLETKVSPPSTTIEKEEEETVPAKPTYKEWKFSYGKDEFGDKDENVKVITLYLDAFRPNYEEDKEHISIDYILYKNIELEAFIFSSSEIGRFYKEISVKLEDGFQYIFSGEDASSNLQGGVGIPDKDDIKQIAEILNNGNFKLKVGNRVANVKNETKGFRESVEKYFKGEDLEVLLPQITRE